MSIVSAGIIYTDSKSRELQIDFAFYFQRKANELKMGTNLDGNVWKVVCEKFFERFTQNLVFEITDAPCQGTSNYLLGGWSFNPNDPTEEYYRVQHLLEDIIKHDFVTKIKMEIIDQFEKNECTHEYFIKAENFAETIKKHYYEVPSTLDVEIAARFIIEK